MTGLENNIKGTTFYKTENGEYKELGILKSIEIKNQNEEEYINMMNDTETGFEFEIKDKETIRKIKQLVKTDKDKKTERRFNKNNFRSFIKNKQ